MPGPPSKRYAKQPSGTKGCTGKINCYNCRPNRKPGCQPATEKAIKPKSLELVTVAQHVYKKHTTGTDMAIKPSNRK